MAMILFVAAIGSILSADEHARLIQYRNLNQVVVNDTFGKKDIFLIVDGTIDIIAKPIFIGESKHLLIYGLYLGVVMRVDVADKMPQDRKSTRLNSSH